MTFDFGELHQNSEPLGTVGGFVDEFIAAVKPLSYFDGFSHSKTVQLTEYFDCFGAVARKIPSPADGAPRLASKFLLFVLQQNVVRLRAMTQAATSVLV